MSYLLVTCRGCHHRWIVEGRPETSECHNCQRQQTVSAALTHGPFETSSEAVAVRTTLVAEGMDEIEAFERASERGQL